MPAKLATPPAAAPDKPVKPAVPPSHLLPFGQFRQAAENVIATREGAAKGLAAYEELLRDPDATAALNARLPDHAQHAADLRALIAPPPPAPAAPATTSET